MAYNKSERLKYSYERFRIFDPGAYQYPNTPLVRPNKVPFLSKAPRQTTFNKIWTHTVHYPMKQESIPNCTSLQSKVPRFRYEFEKPKVTEEVICDCGLEDDLCRCEKPDKEENKEPEICQAKVPRRLFVGPAKSYNIERIVKPTIDVPFYDTRIQELTAFYQGCKWSRWTSRREMRPPEQRPGPADYTLEHPPDMSQICAEKVRAKRRKTSKQLRFIEIVQMRTIRDNHPSPASYTPMYHQRKDFRYPPAKDQKDLPETKTSDHIEDTPGPADYDIRRDFDIKTNGNKKCHAKLPDPSPFGVRDARFKQKIKIGPSPASYCVNNDLCHRNGLKQCNYAPFGSSSNRFKVTSLDDDLTDESDDDCNEKPKCIPKSDQSTWEFKSKTVRSRPPKYTFTGTYENPIDHYNPRPKKLQYLSPFNSSEGRFRNWYNWVSVYGSVRTPDPARYCTEKPKCKLVVFSGTFSRQRRFMPYGTETPAPNQFVHHGIENVLNTYNFKLRNNIRKRCKRQCCTLQRPLPI